MNVRVETETKLVPTDFKPAIRDMPPDEPLMDHLTIQRVYVDDELMFTLHRRVWMFRMTWAYPQSGPGRRFVPVHDRVEEPYLPEELSLKDLFQRLYDIGYEEGSCDMEPSFKYKEGDEPDPPNESYISFEGGPSAA